MQHGPVTGSGPMQPMPGDGEAAPAAASQEAPSAATELPDLAGPTPAHPGPPAGVDV